MIDIFIPLLSDAEPIQGYIALWVMAIFFSSFGTFGLCYVTHLYWEYKASFHWPSTQGVLDEAEIKKTNSALCPLKIRYSYTVNAIEYSGSRYSFDDNIHDRWKTNEEYELFIQNNPIGSTVTVYYSQKKPQKSILTYCKSRRILYCYIVFLPFFLVGLSMLIYCIGTIIQ